MIDMLTAAALTSRHAFFTRAGGVSTGVYESLQCGLGARDDAPEAIAENRARAARAVGAAPEALVTAYQIHSADARAVATPWPVDAAPRIDGMASAAPGVALGVLTADCAPVLLEDRAAGVVGACHAGWRGARAGIIEATVAEMLALGATRARIAAAIGPCIGPDAYEVGPEYRARFLEDAPDNERFFRPAPRPEHFLFDLPGYCAARLGAAGVAVVEPLGRCTYSEPDAFYSHRRSAHRQETDYGRLISIIRVPDRAAA